MSTTSDSGSVIRFGDCAVWPNERRLTIGGDPVAVGPRAFDVLIVLLERAGRVVTRDTLLELAWPGLIVEPNNLNVQISNLRALLGRAAIATIPAIGYRFSLPLQNHQPIVAVRELPSLAGNLPKTGFELIGRDVDVDEASAIVERKQLVTLLGPGGIGKTRLGQAVALRLAERFEKGAWIVELAPLPPLSHPDLLAATIAQTLGLRLAGNAPTTAEVAKAIADDSRLLILDNCEHVVMAAREVANALLALCPGLHILATSQHPLKATGEQHYRLAPLAVTDGKGVSHGDSAAVRLLVARVQAVKPDFELADAEAWQATEICRSLDGLPLAIELAAARVPLLGLSGVRTRVQQQPMRVLTGGPGDALQRHQALQATMDWSYSLLNGPERRAFRRASVFAGGFDLAQALPVLADAGEDTYAVIDPLCRLVDMSLVIVDSADPPRYRLLESSRAYGSDKLGERVDSGEQGATKFRHAQVFDELFQQSLSAEWTMPSQKRRAFYLPDLDNGRAALAWTRQACKILSERPDAIPGCSLEAVQERHASLAAGMAWLFADTGQAAEGLAHCKDALSVCHSGMPVRVEAWLHREICRLNHGAHPEDNLGPARQAVELLRPLAEPHWLYKALGRLSITLTKAGHYDDSALAIAEMRLLRSQGSWPPMSEWDLLNARDYLANDLGDYQEGLELAKQELALADLFGDTAKTVFALMAAEQCAASLERYPEAVVQGQRLIELAVQENEVEHLHVFEFNLAMSLAMCGRIDEAVAQVRHCDRLPGRRATLWKGLEVMALIAWHRKRPKLAAQLIGRSDEEYRGRKSRREPVERNVYGFVVGNLQQSLDAATLAAWMGEGAAGDVELLNALAMTA